MSHRFETQHLASGQGTFSSGFPAVCVKADHDPVGFYGLKRCYPGRSNGYGKYSAMSKNSSREIMRTTSIEFAQIKRAEINSFRSCENSFIRLWHPQAGESAKTAGKNDLCENLLSTAQKWPLDDCPNCRIGGLRKEKSKARKVVCRLLTHLEQAQVHFQFGSFSGHRHKKETIVGINEKYKVKKGIKTKYESDLTIRIILAFLISAVLGNINCSKWR